MHARVADQGFAVEFCTWVAALAGLCESFHDHVRPASLDHEAATPPGFWCYKILVGLAWSRCRKWRGYAVVDERPNEVTAPC